MRKRDPSPTQLDIMFALMDQGGLSVAQIELRYRKAFRKNLKAAQYHLQRLNRQRFIRGYLRSQNGKKTGKKIRIWYLTRLGERQLAPRLSLITAPAQGQVL